MTDEPFVPIEGVADYFSVSVSTVRMWIRQNLVPSLKIGGVYRFKISEVESALRKLGGDESTDGIPLPEGTQLEMNFNPDDDI
jgi:excisionase family DNA binding protein